jgi:hypothetical protein
MSTYLPPRIEPDGFIMSVEVNPLIRVLLGVLIVAFAIVLGVVIIYRAFHAVHPAQVNHPMFCVTSSTIAT